MLEAPNLKACWAAACAAAASCGARLSLFRANSGKAWLSGAGPAVRQPDGSVIVPAARPVALGLALVSGDPVPGQADTQGWTEVIVTLEMVGRPIAVYTAIEMKRTKGGRTSDDQANFVHQVAKAGGIAGVANTPAVAQAIIRDWMCERGVRPA